MSNHTIQPEQSTQSEPTADVTPPSAGGKEVGLVSLQGFFNKPDMSVDEESAVEWIYNYFDEAGYENMTDVLLAIKDAEMRIGMTQLGESRIMKLRNYLKLNSQIEDLMKTKESYER